MMKALFLGSISVLADTSELQRAAFNEAFAEAGLDWHWSRDAYRAMLEGSGGKDRIARYAEERGVEVDAAALHARKTEIFESKLREGSLPVRAETQRMLTAAKVQGQRIAFVSGTSPRTLAALMDGLGGADHLGFDLVTSEKAVAEPKPHPALYEFALATLGLEPQDVLVIEDNRAGVDAAKAAGLTCIAYPNENTRHHDFSDVALVEEKAAAA